MASTSKEEQNISNEEVSPVGDGDGISDLSSECASISSVDTWSSSMIEGKPYTYGSDVVIRRISRSSNGESVYQCDFCDKLFANKYHLQSHHVNHTGERAFTCKICKKAFGRKSTLRAHMTTHTKVSNFMCTVCEKACNDNNSLEEHMRMHTGEKPFVCTICQKAYARKSHLNVHYRVHTGERPFVCNFCDKDFTEKRFLNDHLQTAHNGNDGPLKCPNCSREFAYKTSLKQHLKKQMCERNIKRSNGNSYSNNSTKQFQCPFCEKSYSWKQTLKQHVSMYHRNKLHTDEFWKYELTKNRRSLVDDQINEDLWNKQLGKHGNGKLDQIQRLKKQDHSESQTKEDQIKWFEQIKKSKLTEMTPEMKLLALQSLQKSLQIMSMSGLKTVSENKTFERQTQLIKIDSDNKIAQENSSSKLLPLLKKNENLHNNSFDIHKKNYSSDNETKKMSSQKYFKHKTYSISGADTNNDLWEQQISRTYLDKINTEVIVVNHNVTLFDKKDTKISPNKSNNDNIDENEIMEEKKINKRTLEEKSMLKSLLLDKKIRKRSLEKFKINEKKIEKIGNCTFRYTPTQQILRKRLLGWKEPKKIIHT